MLVSFIKKDDRPQNVFVKSFNVTIKSACSFQDSKARRGKRRTCQESWVIMHIKCIKAKKTDHSLMSSCSLSFCSA